MSGRAAPAPASSTLGFLAFGVLDFNELAVAAGLGLGVLTAFHDRISGRFHVQLDGADGVVVARDHVVHFVRVGVGVDHRHHRDTQLAGFLNGDVLVIHVHHEQSVRQTAHVLDAADGAFHFSISR